MQTPLCIIISIMFIGVCLTQGVDNHLKSGGTNLALLLYRVDSSRSECSLENVLFPEDFKLIRCFLKSEFCIRKLFYLSYEDHK